MTARISIIFLTSFLMLGLVSVASAKTRTYEHERGDYVLELPSSNWRVVHLNGIAHPRTEFVNGKRSAVRLRIRRVYPAASPSDLVVRHQTWDSLFLKGYIIGKDQPFEGTSPHSPPVLPQKSGITVGPGQYRNAVASGQPANTYFLEY